MQENIAHTKPSMIIPLFVLLNGANQRRTSFFCYAVCRNDNSFMELIAENQILFRNEPIPKKRKCQSLSTIILSVYVGKFSKIDHQLYQR